MMLKLMVGASTATPATALKEITNEVPAMIVDAAATYVFVLPRTVRITVSVMAIAVFGTVKLVHPATPAAEKRVMEPDVLLPVVGAAVVRLTV